MGLHKDEYAFSPTGAGHLQIPKIMRELYDKMWDTESKKSELLRELASAVNYIRGVMEIEVKETVEPKRKELPAYVFKYACAFSNFEFDFNSKDHPFD